MLEHLINKYKDKRRDKKEIVYKLSYAGKFIIVKGKTLCGSLMIIANTFEQFRNKTSINEDNPNDYRLIEHVERFKGHLYRHLYNHFLQHKGDQHKFTVKTIAKIGRKIDQYSLLKREQMELDKNRFNKLCLNNVTEAYIPAYNLTTDSFGWLEKSAVMNFKRWLGSKERKAYIKRYTVK